MKVVILGGSGFIGTRLVERLTTMPEREVIIADTRPSRQFPDLWIKTDVRNPDQLRHAFAGADCIYVLAAEHRDDVQPVSLYYNVNVEGAKNVCRVADELNIGNLIFTSSVAVYGPSNEEIDEDGEKSPATDYGKSKLQAEAVYEAWMGDDKNLTIVRPTVVFGEGNRGNVYTLMDQVRRGRFVMVGSGKNIKSMAYVENLAEFLVISLSNLSGVQLFNYVDKPDLTMNQLVAFLYNRVQGGRRPIRIPYMMGLLGGLVFDILALVSGRNFSISRTRIRKFCANSCFSNQHLLSSGFEPQFSLEEGLSRTIALEMKAGRRPK